MQNNKQHRRRLPLQLYDLIVFAAMDIGLYGIYRGGGNLTLHDIGVQTILALVIIFGARYAGKIYRQIWRYGGIQCYIRFLATDAISFLVYLALERVLPIGHISFAKLLAFCCMNTLVALSLRMCYRYAYKCGNEDTLYGKCLRGLLRFFSGGTVATEKDPDSQKIKIAIVGAGSVGVGLAEELRNNPRSKYLPRCFVDIDSNKTGRDVHGLPVLSAGENTLDTLRSYHIQEVVFAVPNMSRERKLALYEAYNAADFKVKVYEVPVMDAPNQRRSLREFRIEDLLMRPQKTVIDQQTMDYYKDKVILITGGGGSIGSELCRQLAKLQPKQLVLVDIYENGVYEVQQELLFTYKKQLDVAVEIISITNEKALARVFAEYRPQICINAAAHKHVPLMEHNCVEAVENNVFGALNVIKCCEAYGCNRFMMVSTDKAVNPTNVMGATKRMCEMIAQAYSTRGTVKCSATRFGNVLGSAGSVIPLFRRQIAAGGPVTVTDKRIIRYFMTIPEAAQLVLASGAMANNGDLFVLDMGNPVKIWDLATSMIALSGMDGIEIVETGLRPGEKLYEELLVKTEELEKTENSLIFIEHESPVTMDQLEEKLRLLESACATQEDDRVRDALHQVVPTYRTPEEVNAAAQRLPCGKGAVSAAD